MFDNYPNIQYEPKAYIKNYYNSITFVDNWIENSVAILEEYTLQNTDTPEGLSFNLYGTSRYWFLLLLINKIQDPFYDWILTDEECYEYAKRYVETLQTWDLTNPVQVTAMNLLIDSTYTAASLANVNKKILIPTKDMIVAMYNEWMKQTSMF